MLNRKDAKLLASLIPGVAVLLVESGPIGAIKAKSPLNEWAFCFYGAYRSALDE